MSKLTLIAFVFISAIVLVRCQEESDQGVEGIWEKVKKFLKSALDSISDIWQDVRKEISARTADISSWTKETFESFKQKLKEWLNARSDIPNAERNEIEDYIEKLQMPPKKDTK